MTITPQKRKEGGRPSFDLRTTFWTESQEHLLMFWGEKATLDARMHDEASAFYSNRYRYLGIPAVLLSGLTGSGTLAAVGLDNLNIWITVSFGCLMLLSAGLSAMHNFLNYGSLAEKHRQSYNMYECTRARIDAELMRPRVLRKDACESVEEFTDMFTNLASTCPETPNWIRKKYEAAVDAKKELLIHHYLRIGDGGGVDGSSNPIQRPTLNRTVSAEAAVEETKQLDLLERGHSERKERDSLSTTEQLQQQFERELQLRRLKTKTRDEKLKQVAESYALQRNAESYALQRNAPDGMFSSYFGVSSKLSRDKSLNIITHR